VLLNSKRFSFTHLSRVPHFPPRLSPANLAAHHIYLDSLGSTPHSATPCGGVAAPKQCLIRNHHLSCAHECALAHAAMTRLGNAIDHWALGVGPPLPPFPPLTRHARSPPWRSSTLICSSARPTWLGRWRARGPVGARTSAAGTPQAAQTRPIAALRPPYRWLAPARSRRRRSQPT
jgi:hypothetical protein